MNDENLHTINCIIYEIELLKKYIKELEERVKELENDNEQRESVLRKVPKNA
jgi:hypothetical protein